MKRQLLRNSFAEMDDRVSWDAIGELGVITLVVKKHHAATALSRDGALEHSRVCKAMNDAYETVFGVKRPEIEPNLGPLPSHITPRMVKQLRDESGAAINDAKRALIEADGNMERARDLLAINRSTKWA